MIVWGPMLDACNLNKLQRLQNKAVSTLFPKLHIDAVFEKSKILRVRSLIKLEEYKLGYKIVSQSITTTLAGMSIN